MVNSSLSVPTIDNGQQYFFETKAIEARNNFHLLPIPSRVRGEVNVFETPYNALSVAEVIKNTINSLSLQCYILPLQDASGNDLLIEEAKEPPIEVNYSLDGPFQDIGYAKTQGLWRFITPPFFFTYNKTRPGYIHPEQVPNLLNGGYTPDWNSHKQVDKVFACSLGSLKEIDSFSKALISFNRWF